MQVVPFRTSQSFGMCNGSPGALACTSYSTMFVLRTMMAKDAYAKHHFMHYLLKLRKVYRDNNSVQIRTSSRKFVQFVDDAMAAATIDDQINNICLSMKDKPITRNETMVWGSQTEFESSEIGKLLCHTYISITEVMVCRNIMPRLARPETDKLSDTDAFHFAVTSLIGKTLPYIHSMLDRSRWPRVHSALQFLPHYVYRLVCTQETQPIMKYIDGKRYAGYEGIGSEMRLWFRGNDTEAELTAVMDAMTTDTDSQYTVFSRFVGDRFSVDILCGHVNTDDMNSIKNVYKARTVLYRLYALVTIAFRQLVASALAFDVCVKMQLCENNIHLQPRMYLSFLANRGATVFERMLSACVSTERQLLRQGEGLMSVLTYDYQRTLCSTNRDCGEPLTNVDRAWLNICDGTYVLEHADNKHDLFTRPYMLQRIIVPPSRYFLSSTLLYELTPFSVQASIEDRTVDYTMENGDTRVSVYRMDGCPPLAMTDGNTVLNVVINTRVCFLSKAMYRSNLTELEKQVGEINRSSATVDIPLSLLELVHTMGSGISGMLMTYRAGTESSVAHCFMQELISADANKEIELSDEQKKMIMFVLNVFPHMANKSVEMIILAWDGLVMNNGVKSTDDRLSPRGKKRSAETVAGANAVDYTVSMVYVPDVTEPTVPLCTNDVAGVTAWLECLEKGTFYMFNTHSVEHVDPDMLKTDNEVYKRNMMGGVGAMYMFDRQMYNTSVAWVQDVSNAIEQTVWGMGAQQVKIYDSMVSKIVESILLAAFDTEEIALDTISDENGVAKTLMKLVDNVHGRKHNKQFDIQAVPFVPNPLCKASVLYSEEADRPKQFLPFGKVLKHQAETDEVYAMNKVVKNVIVPSIVKLKKHIDNST